MICLCSAAERQVQGARPRCGVVPDRRHPGVGGATPGVGGV